MNAPGSSGVGADQLRYARVLEWGARSGLVAVVVAFTLYVSGALPGRVPLEELSSLWSLPLADYLHRTATPVGWGWLVLANYGDFASLAGIALLATCSVPCLVAVLPIFARRSDRVYVALCLLELAVLALAASGVLVVTH